MPFDRKSKTDGVTTYFLVRTNPGVRLKRLSLAIRAHATLGSAAVGYLGITGGADTVNFMFSVEPKSLTVIDFDKFLDALPTLPPELPNQRARYAAMTTDSSRIAFLADHLGLI